MIFMHWKDEPGLQFSFIVSALGTQYLQFMEEDLKIPYYDVSLIFLSLMFKKNIFF